MTRFIFFFICSIILISCGKEVKPEIDLSHIDIELDVVRFEQEFYNASQEDLPTLKKKHKILFPESVPDSVWNNRMTNEEEQYLFEEATTVFDDFEKTEVELTDLFKHIIYYKPNFVVPKLYTYISDMDYEYPIIYADSLLFISLDMYLGKGNIVYKEFPLYLAQNYNKENVVVDVAESIVERWYPNKHYRQFIDKIIEAGKRKYLIDLFLPQVQDHLKMGYDSDKMEWAVNNEINIWKYFMEKEYLFSNDANLDTRFINVAPFSKFYQETDQDSPGQIGVWMGWQIVDAFMKNNDVTLQQLMTMPPQEVFKKSKYKPRKQ